LERPEGKGEEEERADMSSRGIGTLRARGEERSDK